MADQPDAPSPDNPGASQPQPSAIQPCKKPNQSQKKNWLLTYCPAGTYITPEMLKEDGIDADECHSTSDRVMNFTYIHLVLKVRQTRIEKFMRKIKDSHGITQNEIFGYDSIASGSSTNKLAPSIQQHIVFQMLIKHYKEKSPSFKPNTNGEEIIKKGHLFHALGIPIERTVDLQFQNKRQLIVYAKSLEQKLEESKKQEAEMQTLATTYVNCAQERNALRVENANCTQERNALRVENAAMKRKISQLETLLQPPE